MKLWHLIRILHPDYDEYAEKIICAETEEEARKIANEKVGDEGKIWTDAQLVSCKEVENTKKGVIIAVIHPS